MTGNTKYLNRLNHALRFAANGTRVIPLRPNSKEPLISDWKRNASANPDQIRQWFEEYPNCNYALLMGEGRVVLDVDVKNGKNGPRSLRDLIEGHKFLDTLIVKTPTSGLHYYYLIRPTTESNLVTRHGFMDGLDFQASGSYVVGPGSTIGDQDYCIFYDPKEIATIPDWLIDATRKAPAPSLIAAPAAMPTARPIPALRLTSGSAEVITSHLDNIDPDLPRDAWIETLFAAQNVFGDQDETIKSLRLWSEAGKTYTEKEFHKAVFSRDPSAAVQVGMPRLLEIARKYPRPDHWLPHHDEANNLESRVMSTVVEMLERHNNKPNSEHRKGIEAIVKAMTHGAYEQDVKFRKAFPLETGMGKTTCVVALVKQLQHTDKSLLISAERIEQLGELQAQLIDEGVPANKLGIFHSSPKKYPEYPSVTLAELDRVQFLLASHNRVRVDSQRSVTERLMSYQGHKRDLTIWDESLLSTSADSMDRAEVRKVVGGWIVDYQEKLRAGRKSSLNESQFHEFYEFLIDIDKQLAQGQGDGVFTLPLLRLGITDYDIPINAWSRKDERSSAVLKKLVEYSGRGEVRTVKTQDGHALVQFTQTVDDDIDKMIILDASARIRDLVRYDRSVGVFPLNVSKDYGNVMLKWADVGSSKTSFSSDPNHLRAYLGEMDYLLTTEIPKDQPFLIFCHMDMKDQIREWANEIYPLREIFVLHWGEHRATNHYSHVQYMATIGVLYRNTKEIAASIVGQTRDLRYGLADADIRQTQISEQADLLYQGISRGNSRRTTNGQAGQQTVYLFHRKHDFDNILPLLREVMPGLKVENYKPTVLKPPVRQNSLDYIHLGERVVDHLIRLPADQTMVSVRAVKSAIARDIDPNSSLWRNGKNYALNSLVGWRQQGQAFRRF